MYGKQSRFVSWRHRPGLFTRHAGFRQTGSERPHWSCTLAKAICTYWPRTWHPVAEVVPYRAVVRRGGSRAETGEATTSKGFQLAEQRKQEGKETELAAIPANEF